MKADVTPLDVITKPRHKAKTRIPNDALTRFTHVLYQELGNRIAPFAFQYMKPPHLTADEHYAIWMIWAHGSNDFISLIELKLHTAKGLMESGVSCLGRDGSKREGLEFRIVEILEDCASRLDVLARDYLELQHYAISFSTDVPLAGSYRAGTKLIYPVDSETKLPEVWAITKVSAESEKLRIANLQTESHNLAAALTLATQNLFSPLFIYKPLSETPPVPKAGPLFDDTAMSQRDAWDSTAILDPKSLSGEIIEEGDLRREGRLILPQSIEDLIPLILEKPTLLNAARCFHAGLTLRKTVCNSDLLTSSTIVGYEMLSYVSAIESIVESQNKYATCRKCGAEVDCGPGHIRKSYNTFVSNISGGNQIFEKTFADLYNRRSNFLHKGTPMFKMDEPITSGPPCMLKKKSNFSPYPPGYFQIYIWTGWLLRRHIYLTELTNS
jgi:hypothetical protein